MPCAISSQSLNSKLTGIEAQWSVSSVGTNGVHLSGALHDLNSGQNQVNQSVF